jgi:hypothetical protein
MPHVMPTASAMRTADWANAAAAMIATARIATSVAPDAPRARVRSEEPMNGTDVGMSSERRGR